jgi:hypothetical protein
MHQTRLGVQTVQRDRWDPEDQRDQRDQTNLGSLKGPQDHLGLTDHWAHLNRANPKDLVHPRPPTLRLDPRDPMDQGGLKGPRVRTRHQGL